MIADIITDIKKAEYLNNQINKCIVSAEENYEHATNTADK